MFLSLLIILIIVLIAGAFFLAPDNPDDGSPALMQGLSQIRSMTEGTDDEKTTTTVYKWQDADGEWHFSNTPPPQGVASQVQTYRSDTNTIPAAQRDKPAGVTTSNTPILGPLGTAKKTIDDARAVQGLNDNRTKMLDQQIDAND